MSWVDATVWKCDKCEEIIIVPIGFIGPEVEQIADHECNIGTLNAEMSPQLMRDVLDALKPTDWKE